MKLQTFIVCFVVLFSVGCHSCWFDRYECQVTKKCINRDQVRNGRYNCGVNDTSDEVLPLSRCNPRKEFRCRINGQCVERKWINRGISVCNDSSDEGGIANFPCIRNEEVKCSGGNCVAYRLADTFSDCPSVLEQKNHNGKAKECKTDCDEEDSMPRSCSEDEYQCADGQCIPRHQVGNKYRDCDNDEEKGLITNCTKSEFTCEEKDTNGTVYIRCIPRAWINDGFAQCEDGSDERVTSLRCHANEWSCDKGTKCLTTKQLCDGVPDCLDCSDETNSSLCSIENRAQFFTCQRPIELGEKFTGGGVTNSHCVLRSYFCDGMMDCADESDELAIGSGFKCRITKRNKGNDVTRSCILPSYLLHDGHADCDDGSDETADDTIDNIQHFSCVLEKSNLVSQTIKHSQVCDGVFDCHNLVDECLCIKELHPPEYDISTVCDNICYGYEISTKNNRSIFGRNVSEGIDLSGICELCPPKTMLCTNERHHSQMKDYQCISFEKVCDGVRDCENGEDELFCRDDSNKENDKLETKSFYKCFIPPQLSYIQNRYPEEIPNMARRCDGVPECAGLGDECDDVTDDDSDAACRLRKEKPEYCKHFTSEWWLENWSPSKWQSQLCDGFGHWENNLDEKYCGDTRFYCKAANSSDKVGSHNKISIELERVCDGNVDCNDQSDELNCSEHFYCLYSNHPLFVSRTKVLDGVSDCADGSDECPDPKAYEDDPISSRDQLIKFPMFQVMIWLIGLIAAIGNTVVFASTLKRVFLVQFDTALCSPMEKCFLKNEQDQCPPINHRTKHYCSPLAKCNDVLVLNLALADFLTGLYLLIIAIKSSVYSGLYCTHEMAWRSSTECENVGSLILTASLASVLTLVVLTSYRLFAILKPWKMKQCRVKVVMLWIFLIWVFSASVGLLPRSNQLSDFFVTSLHLNTKGGAVMRKPVFFPSHVVSKISMSTFLTRACVLFSSSATKTQMCNDIVHGDSQWVLLTEALNTLFEDIEVSGYFGYFSHHGVCLPALFQSSPLLSGSTVFTAAVMGLTFVLFVYIAFVYIMICFRSSKLFRGAKKAADDDKEGKAGGELTKVARMHRRIARLVLTDFLCWMPVCLISFCSLAGVSTPSWLYSFAIVFLLPINSALNPLLYSDVLSNILKRGMRKLNFKNKSQPPELGQTPFSNNVNMSPIIKGAHSSQTAVGCKRNRENLSAQLNKGLCEQRTFSKRCTKLFSSRSASRTKTDKRREVYAKSFTPFPSETVTTYISTNATTSRRESLL